MTQFRTTAVKKSTPVDYARQIGDAGIVASLFVAPLWFGGRHDLGYLLYAVAVAVAAVGVFAHAALVGAAPRMSRAALVLLTAAMVLLGLQSAPLPPEMHAWLAPHAGRVLPMWGGGEGALGTWRTLSVAPAETREGLALLACHALLLVSVATRLRAAEDARRLLAWIGCAGAAMAAFAFVQHAASNGKLFWVLDHPHREMGDAVQGVFTNPNHFAHFMALAIGPLSLLLVEATDSARGRRGFSKKPPLLLGLFSLVIVAGLASESRGGGAALLVAAVTATLVAWWCGAVRRGRLFAVALVALAVISGVSLYGYDRVAGRLDDLASGDVDTLDESGARRAIWAANLAALRVSPRLGLGAGAHRDFYPVFLKESYNREFTHAESGYLQVASETGLAGLLLLGSGIALLAWWAFAGLVWDRNAERRLLWLGVAPGLAASAAHSVVDFVWYTPGLTAIVVALTACAMRLRAIARGEETPVRRSGAGEIGLLPLARVAAVTTFAALAIGTLLPSARGALDWDRYLRVSHALRGMSSRLAYGLEDADSTFAQALKASTAHATELLRRVVEADPSNARAHLRLAGRLLQRFDLESAEHENRMSLELIHDAAVSGGFPTHGAMLEWLERAYGERATHLRLAHTHARRAVELAPLQGEGYLYLAALSFLEPGSLSRGELVSRALAVRPFDGEVLFEAGRQRHLEGRGEEAIDLWRRSAQRPGSHQLKLVMMLAGKVSAEEFVEALRPNHAVVTQALGRYREVGTEDDLVALAEYARELARTAEAEGGTDAARLASRWVLVSRTKRSVKDHEAAIEAARRAAVLAPHVFKVRLELATALREAERFDEADPHLRWCLARRPDIRYLHVWLTEAAKRRTLVDQNRRSRQRLYTELAARARDVDAAENTARSTDSTPDRR